MDKFEIAHVKPADRLVLLIVTSTFGNGEAPENGKKFKSSVLDLLKEGKV
jgi:hypothetical protein